MSEIEKMYENAGVKVDRIVCYRGFDNCIDNDFNCHCHNEKHCEDATKIYPPFTAEKQMLLLDFLSKYEVTIINESNTPYYMIYTHDKVGSVKANNIGELMAKYINMFIWQGLTEKEKQQVKEILE